MFTGIVEERGLVLALRRDVVLEESDQEKVGWILVVQSIDGVTYSGTQLGDSVAVNGVCLTVTRLDDSAKSFTFGCAPETMRRTDLGTLVTGSEVNLERALHLSATARGGMRNERFGGHFVEGHVDGVGIIAEMTPEEESMWVKVSVSSDMARYIVEKGYIAIDGTSLTVCEVGKDYFKIMMIAFTQSKVTLSRKKVGDSVNIELDILAKYVEKIALGAVDTEKVVQGVWQHVGNVVASESKH